MITVSEQTGTYKKAHTFLHCNLLWSLIGPMMPNDTPLNHHHEAVMVNAMTPNTIPLVLVLKRLDEKTK